MLHFYTERDTLRKKNKPLWLGPNGLKGMSQVGMERVALTGVIPFKVILLSARQSLQQCSLNWCTTTGQKRFSLVLDRRQAGMNFLICCLIARKQVTPDCSTPVQIGVCFRLWSHPYSETQQTTYSRIRRACWQNQAWDWRSYFFGLHLPEPQN